MNPAVLKERARIVRGIRRFFDERDFVEVETDVLIAAPAPEEFIDCPCVVASAGGAAVAGFLRASPELQMKKLLSAGMERIYQLGPCFREGEKGARHNPEFTMLEWYRRAADYLAIADDLERLVAAVGLPRPEGGYRRLTVRQAYAEFAGWDPFVAYDRDRFDVDMANKIEPAIKALGGGVLLMDYPREAASLAKLRGEVAERWEFYFDGIELANCFTELCEADEQRRRFEKARAERRRLGEADYPLDEEFLSVLPRIGSAAGVALGVDRLVMSILGLPTISQARGCLPVCPKNDILPQI